MGHWRVRHITPFDGILLKPILDDLLYWAYVNWLISDSKTECLVRLLFVCVGNTCRSQMAEGIARDLGHEAASAGTHAPESGRVAKYAIEVLEEIGVDTSDLRPKKIDSVYPGEYDAIISMGCGVSCPAVPIDEDWGLEDPHGREKEVYRKTRDAIRILVSNLVGSYTDA